MPAAKIRLTARVYLLLALLQGLLVLGVLLRQRSESEQAVMLGLSATRITLAAALLAIVVSWALLLLLSFVRPAWFDQASWRLSAWLSRPKVWGWAFVVSLAGFFSGLYLLLLTPEVSEPFTRAIFDRLLPLLLYLSGLCAFNLLVLGALRAPTLRQNKKPLAGFLALYLLLVLLALLPWLWLAGQVATRPERLVGLNALGVPVLETQVLLGLLLALTISGVFLWRLPFTGGWRLADRLSPRAIDAVLALALWLLAVVLWSSIPITPNWFVSEPRPPNFEPYPNSDALGYDLASQIMLVGEGYHFVNNLLSHRPIHTLYLTLLHAAAGQEYNRLVFFQIVLLALFPVLVYLLGRKLTNRLAGLLAGLLIILREANSVAGAGVITSSHVKSLMVDLPGALGVALLLLLLARWLENPRQRLLDLLLAGGVWGMLILLRQEFAGLALTILLALLVAYWKLPRWLLKGGLIFTLGALLVLSPWLYRNTRMVGLSLEEIVRYQVGFLRWRYSANTASATEFEAFVRSQPTPTPTPLVPALGEPFPRQIFVPPTATPLPAGPTPRVQATATTPPTQATPTTQPVTESGSETSPGGPTRLPFSDRLGTFVETGLLHTVNSQDQLLFYLPGSLRLFDSLTGFLGHRDALKLWEECCSLESYLRRLPFWHKWEGSIPSQSLLLLLANLFLLALGLSAVWKGGRRLAGLLPLVAAGNYILVNAAVQNSGGRYILPVDWVSLLYYSAGLAAVSWWLIGILRGKAVSIAASQPGESSFQSLFISETPLAVEPAPRQRFSLRNPWLVGTLIGMLLVGCALPLLESAIPKTYPPTVQAAMLEGLLASDRLTPSERGHLDDLLAEPGSAVYAGRALYPRFFKAEQGEVGSRNPLGPRPYARLGFYLAGPDSQAVIMPLEDAPGWLPHTTDVLVIAGADRRAAAIAIFDADLQPVQLLLGKENP